ncbi:hypothetical protein DICVIV_13094 [Dictyocaulus viviparus]|uniref:Phosphofructokinase domain-containing protein n=1 Tax=Dictyocaulus viviparus TaxID=29172 RepID=A0A0D8XBB2_DICVI|nr:hypothetical protein DICVIV_13094 [Dictyocaulus viviparus]
MVSCLLYLARAMIIETMGERCGFLATMAAIATGADKALIFQKKFGEKDIKEMIKDAATKAGRGCHYYTVIRSEGANDAINSSYIKNAFNQLVASHKMLEQFQINIKKSLYKKKWGEKLLSASVNVLCSTQEGGSPSTFDRQMGLRMAIKAFYAFVNTKAMGEDDCCVLGLVGRELKFAPVTQLAEGTCFCHRLPSNLWWMSLFSLISELSGIVF